MYVKRNNIRHYSAEFNVSPVDEDSKNLPFYCIESGFFSSGDLYSFERENLENYLLIVTKSGCGRMMYRGMECVLGKGSAVLIDCRPYQEYGTLPGQIWDFYFVHFQGHAMNGYKKLFDKLSPVMLGSEESACRMMELILTHTERGDQLSRAIISNALSNLLTEMLCSLDENKPHDSAENINIIVHLADYIRSNCVQQLHLEDFMRITNLSKNHLVRSFSKQFGMPPYRYLHFCRINLARHLLRNTNMSVSETANAVGYSDPIVFTRHFRAFCDVPPSEYRRIPHQEAADRDDPK